MRFSTFSRFVLSCVHPRVVEVILHFASATPRGWSQASVMSLALGTESKLFAREEPLMIMRLRRNPVLRRCVPTRERLARSDFPRGKTSASWEP